MSHYKTINGVKYDRNILTLADLLVAKENDAIISMADAKALHHDVYDAGRMTAIEKDTVAYILANYQWTTAAKKWFEANQYLKPAQTQPADLAMLSSGPPNPIRQLLNIADDGSIPNRKVIIDGATLQSIDAKGEIPALLIKAFDNKPIVIDRAQANAVSNATTDVTITGVSGFRLKGSGVATTATFSMMEGNVQAFFQFTVIGNTPPATPWTFGSSFPELPTVLNPSHPGAPPTSPLNSLILKNAQFLVTTYAQTYEGQALIKGINFRADMTPTGVLSVFETLIGKSGHLKLRGTINIPGIAAHFSPLKAWQFPWDVVGTPPGIHLVASLAESPFELGPMQFQAKVFHIYSATSEEWFAKNNTYALTVAYTGAFLAPSAHINLGVTVLTPPGTNGAKIIGDFSKTPLGNLGQLVDLIGTGDILHQLPSEIQTGQLGGLGIQGASITLSYEKKLKVTSASVTVGMPELNWKVWPDRFEIDSISAKFDVQNPFDQTMRRFDILLRGKTQVEGVEVDIAAQKAADFAVTISVPNGFNIPLKSLMQTYIPAVPPVSDLAINSLDVVIAPKQYYSMSLLMAQKPNPWVIGLGATSLTFSNVGLFLMKPSNGKFMGTFSGTAEIAGLALNARYDIPGDIIIRGDLPSLSLSQMVSFILHDQVQLPRGMDLTFTQSYIILQKKNSDYKLELGTVIENIGSLAFVVERGTEGWGFAAGLQVELSQLKHLSGGIESAVNAFASWFPFQTFTLAISTLKDQHFTFPGFKQFNQTPLGQSKITLPPIAQGIQKGFYLYTSTVFTRKNHILKALIDLLKIPEGTQLDGFIAYLYQKKQFQMGVSLTTFLTPLSDVSQRTCTGHLGYQNTCLSGTMMVLAGPGGDFSFSLMASLKTILDHNDLEFDVIISVVENGVFVSGTMKVEKPIDFGPLSLGGLAIELGISFEGLPSFGFSGELEVDGLFDSTLAVLVDTANPADSMIAGALSDLTLGGIIKKLLGEIHEPAPEALIDVLDTIAIKGSKEGQFTVPGGTASSDLENALNQFNGSVIENAFIQYGKQSAFPSTSDGLMIFNDRDHGKWYITEQAGSGDSATVTHWQLVKNPSTQAIDVSKEAQFYFVPNPSGINIGTFYFPSGMKVSGEIEFLMFKLDVDAELQVNKGIKIDAQMDKISFISDSLFSITADEGSGGPKVSIATFKQPNEPKEFQDPHFFINGKMTVLGSSLGVYVNINKSGAAFEVDGSSIGGIFSGSLSGSFNAQAVDIAGSISVGIPDINLGKLGTWHIATGVYANAKIYAHMAQGDYGASFTAGFELAGTKHDLGTIALDVHVASWKGLVDKLFDAVEQFLIKLFTDPKYWAEMAAKVLGWVEDKVQGILEDHFGLSPQEAKAIVNTLEAFCPIITAVKLL